ncbi:LysR family transcriptional regulator [Paenibacillus abyssi]|uniref:LysR family transcriptional regulator n=1 Tax=Paenibacillus abyssi TaxID=1340531 RepID=A0A917CSA5_9BACL|nr:LysR family transcriptional regulator [Paenibacillus abyssi]GGF97912.1 LysR family transcriptional regulator [Paenibacillus abyssi]
MSVLKMRLLVLIDRLKQVTAVANALNLKQPSVSFHMKKMEADWGVKLFEARTGRIMLTGAGKMLLPYASQIVALHEEAESRIAEMRGSGRNRFVIGFTDCAAATLARSDWMTKIGAIKDIGLTMRTGSEDELYNSLQSGVLDLVLCGKPPVHASSVTLLYEPVLSSPLKLVVPTGHTFADNDEISPNDLYAYPFIAHSDPSINERTRLWETGLEQPLDIRVTLESVEMVIGAVHAQMGLSILPDCVLSDPARRVSGIHLPGNLPEWTLYASWRKDYWNPSLLQQILTLF